MTFKSSLSYLIFLYWKMEISRQYYSAQSLLRGQLVQLEENMEGYVTALYDRRTLSSSLNLQQIKVIRVWENMAFVLNQQSRSQLILSAFTTTLFEPKNSGNPLANVRPSWSGTFSALDFANIQMVVGDTGIFVSFFSNGNVFLPNGSSIQQTPAQILTRLSLDGQVVASTFIQGSDLINITFDNSTKTAVIYGNSNLPLVISRRVIISRTMSPYSFVVFLSLSLVAEKTFVDDQTVVELLVAGNKNIAYIDQNNYLFYYEENGNNWDVSFQGYNVLNLLINNNTIIIVFRDNSTGKYYFQNYDISGNVFRSGNIPITGTVITASMNLQNTNRLFVLVLREDILYVEEYDLLQLVRIMSKSVPNNSIFVSGSDSLMGVASTSNLQLYQTTMTRLVGVVSQILTPSPTPLPPGQQCPPGFYPCVDCPPCNNRGCTGFPIDGCCPEQLLPNCKAPMVVQVDFGITTALAPLIPGQEYFIDSQKRLTTDSSSNRYLGTALDSTTLYMNSS